MMNQIVIVGRIKELVKQDKWVDIKLSVPRSYKNTEGEYETDLVPIKIWNPIAGNVLEYCTENDVVGIKGRIESDGETIKIIAERVTLLSSNRKSEK